MNGDWVRRNGSVRRYLGLVGILYLLMVIATWALFKDEGHTFLSAVTGSLVYTFYIAIVFGAVALATVVAVEVWREDRTPR